MQHGNIVNLPIDTQTLLGIFTDISSFSDTVGYVLTIVTIHIYIYIYIYIHTNTYNIHIFRNLLVTS